MSNDVSVFAKRRVIGSATLKGVLLYMADNASDDGTGIWTSKANIARDLELSKRSVQLSIQSLIDRGIVFEDGKRKCVNGFTVQYSIRLNVLNSLPSTRDDKLKLTGEPHSPVNHIHLTGEPHSPLPVNPIHLTGEPHSPKPSLNHPLEPSLNHPCADADLFGAKVPTDAKEPIDRFEEFWKAYPKQSGKPSARKNFDKAVKDGADPDAIITGAKRYALWLSSGGPKDFRPIAKWPQGWLSDERWNDEDLPELPDEKPKFEVGSPEDLAERRKRLGPRFGEGVR
jgi:biotin operon repressor